MSRERDAIELIWKEIESVKSNWPKQVDWCNSYHARIEQILTQMEDLIQEDLEQMESSCRSRETSKTCPLLEEFNKSQAATNTKTFWDSEQMAAAEQFFRDLDIAFPPSWLEEDTAEGDILSKLDRERLLKLPEDARQTLLNGSWDISSDSDTYSPI